MRANGTPFTTGTVTSADGTTIGYRRFGAGPAAVLLHGGVNSARHMMKLGHGLADAFTLVLPDRRGRGMSGPIAAPVRRSTGDRGDPPGVHRDAGTDQSRPDRRGGDMGAEVLLMYGSVSDPIFAATADALHGVLPRSTVVRLPGLNHASAQSYGKPEAIAVALRVFFSS